MRLLISILLNAVLIYVAAYLLQGVFVANYVSAIIAAMVLGIVNWTIKPLITIITLPVTFITFGLFLLVINGLMVMLAAYIVPGFAVGGLFQAIIFVIVLAIFNLIVGNLDMK